MNPPSERTTQKPRTLLRRRPGDFTGRGSGVLYSPGCCCCCCCLHWIGAVAGGAAGIVAAWRGERKRDPPIHPIAKRDIGCAACAGVLATAGLLILLGMAADSPGWPIRPTAEAVALSLAFVPSLALLPVGAAAMLAAVFVKLRAATMSDPVERARMRAGVRLAWRITWKSFVWATFLSGFGYLVMYLIALFLD